MDKELIDRLMDQALDSMPQTPVMKKREFCERFAALIAEECAKIAEADDSDPGSAAAAVGDSGNHSLEVREMIRRKLSRGP